MQEEAVTIPLLYRYYTVTMPLHMSVTQIIKEGYMRKKKPGNSKLQDMKRSWER